VAARGTAVVSFRVDAGGRIASVALAASSGDAGLDRAAVRTIRDAGPCPAPPPGAETAFSIRVQGR
jgi:protein TonB